MPSRMRRFVQHAVLQCLRAYKWAISPMFPPACRYVPTCSEYAMEAVERFGVIRGGFMAMSRLLRCHPLVKGGYDPVVKAGAGSSAPACHPERSEGSRVVLAAPREKVLDFIGPRSYCQNLERNS